MTKRETERPATSGSFKPGNQAAKGKGRKPKVAELREAELLRKAFTPERLDQFLNTVFEYAMKGDSYCMRFIADRFFPAEFMAHKLVTDESKEMNDVFEHIKAALRKQSAEKEANATATAQG
jgi:hypothetical protein